MKRLELTWNKGIIIAIMMLSIFLLFTSVDLQSRDLIDKSFDQALVVFGSAKALNAVISLAQGTELGVGITVSIGEVLDPINDLVEQFSWIMLASLTSLGIQKIAMNFITSTFFNIVFIGSIITSVFFLLFSFQESQKIRNVSLGLAVGVIFLRFAIPLMSILNTTVYDNFVKKDYNIEHLQNNISTIEKNIEDVRSESSNSLIGKFFDHSKYIDKYTALAKQASDNIISLVIAFIFQTVLFPILFLLFLYLLLKRVFFVLT